MRYLDISSFYDRVILKYKVPIYFFYLRLLKLTLARQFKILYKDTGILSDQNLIKRNIHTYIKSISFH